MNNDNVTLIEVIAAARRQHASLVPESSGYLLLAISRAMGGLALQVQAQHITLRSDGAVTLVGSRERTTAAVAANGLGGMLSTLLDVSIGRNAALRAAVAAATQEINPLDRLVTAVTKALIPINRGAAKRALARLARETARAIKRGQLRPQDVAEEQALAAQRPALAQPTAALPQPAPATAAPAQAVPAQAAPAQATPAQAAAPPVAQPPLKQAVSAAPPLAASRVEPAVAKLASAMAAAAGPPDAESTAAPQPAPFSASQPMPAVVGISGHPPVAETAAPEPAQVGIDEEVEWDVDIDIDLATPTPAPLEPEELSIELRTVTPPPAVVDPFDAADAVPAASGSPRLSELELQLPHEEAPVAPVALPPVATPVPPKPAMVLPPEPAFVEPASALAEPSAPVAEACAPAAKPSVPAAKPSVPAAMPSAPAAMPSAPAAKPSVPAAMPSAPAASPSVPVAEPRVPLAVEAAPLPEPLAPQVEPAASSREPAADAAIPAEPLGDPPLAAAACSVEAPPSAATQSPLDVGDELAVELLQRLDLEDPRRSSLPPSMTSATLVDAPVAQVAHAREAAAQARDAIDAEEPIDASEPPAPEESDTNEENTTMLEDFKLSDDDSHDEPEGRATSELLGREPEHTEFEAEELQVAELQSAVSEVLQLAAEQADAQYEEAHLAEELSSREAAPAQAPEQRRAHALWGPRPEPRKGQSVESMLDGFGDSRAQNASIDEAAASLQAMMRLNAATEEAPVESEPSELRVSTLPEAFRQAIVDAAADDDDSASSWEAEMAEAEPSQRDSGLDVDFDEALRLGERASAAPPADDALEPALPPEPAAPELSEAMFAAAFEQPSEPTEWAREANADPHLADHNMAAPDSAAGGNLVADWLASDDDYPVEIAVSPVPLSPEIIAPTEEAGLDEPAAAAAHASDIEGASIPPTFIEDDVVPVRRSPILLAAAMLCGGLAVGGYLWTQRSAMSGENAAGEAEAAAAVETPTAGKCLASLTLNDLPPKYELLLHLGVLPTAGEEALRSIDVPTGVRLEVVGIAPGHATQRLIIPADTSWTSLDGGGRESALELQLKPGVAGAWPSAPAGEVGGIGPAGTLRLAGGPAGAEVWLVVGAGEGTSAPLQLPCAQSATVLVVDTADPKRRRRLSLGQDLLHAAAASDDAVLSASM